MGAIKFASLSKGPTPTRPLLDREGVAFAHNFLRDQFTITTWLLIGALLQAALGTIPISTKYRVLPVVVFILWQLLDTVMISCGLRKNTYMDHVLQAKYAALAPDESGNFTSNSVGKAAGGKNVCVFILGFRVNHPLSLAAPGAFKIMQHFVSMRDDLEKNASVNGFLGNEVLLNSGHRTSKSEIKTIWYFSSMNDVMAFAQSPVHRNGWDYYNKVIKQYTYLGIMHEMYETAAGQWENVYVNHQPVGLAATSFPKADKDGMSWFDPIADARKGQLASTMGRLGRDRSEM